MSSAADVTGADPQPAALLALLASVASEVAQEDQEVTQDGESGEESDEETFFPLYAAIAGPVFTVNQHGDNEPEVRRLLAEGADVNQTTRQGWTPLMVSGSTGQPSIMHLLLRAGADISGVDHQRNSALDWTRHTVRGFEDDVVLSLERGAGHAECIQGSQDLLRRQGFHDTQHGFGCPEGQGHHDGKAHNEGKCW